MCMSLPGTKNTGIVYCSIWYEVNRVQYWSTALRRRTCPTYHAHIRRVKSIDFVEPTNPDDRQTRTSTRQLYHSIPFASLIGAGLPYVISTRYIKLFFLTVAAFIPSPQSRVTDNSHEWLQKAITNPDIAKNTTLYHDISAFHHIIFVAIAVVVVVSDILYYERSNTCIIEAT
jgi:hypothetical protein